MKNIFLGLVVLVISLISLETEALSNFNQAQLSDRCCDASGQMRCRENKRLPIGTECYCPAQGYGKIC